MATVIKSNAESDVQHLLFRHQGVALCGFRCPAGHRRWSRENRIGDGHNVAFPKACVEIHPARHRPFLADPNQVIYYNNGDLFHRRLIQDSGDAANVLLFETGHVTAALEAHDPAVAEHIEAPFVYRNAPIPARIHLRQRLLFEYVARASNPDPLQVVETSLDLLGEVLDVTYDLHHSRRSPRKETTRSDHREHVEEIKRRLTASLADPIVPITLEDLARQVGLSIYHMSRVFRHHTGLPVYRYLRRLRLRAALDWLADSGRPLVEIALDAGFANQSHFTEAFRREYGVRPGELRNRIATQSQPLPTGTS